jgi:hypothetical protein
VPQDDTETATARQARTFRLITGGIVR